MQKMLDAGCTGPRAPRLEGVESKSFGTSV